MKPLALLYGACPVAQCLDVSPGEQKFQCHLAAQLPIACQTDASHPAGADRPNDLVAAETSAGFPSGCISSRDDFRGSIPNGFFQRIRRLIERGQERFAFLAHGLVAGERSARKASRSSGLSAIAS